MLAMGRFNNDHFQWVRPHDDVIDNGDVTAPPPLPDEYIQILDVVHRRTQGSTLILGNVFVR